MKITINNLTKEFDDIKVIKDLSFEIEDKQLVTLLGPSGCGKSTILRIIAGLIEKNSGELLFDGQDISNLKTEKRNIGFVFQDYAMFEHLSVKKNIMYPLKNDKSLSKVIRNEMAEAIAFKLGIEDQIDKYPDQLSGGQRQRVAIARALVKKPDILLLDEPFANLDAKLKIELRKEVKKIQREMGITAILVTHDQEEALSMSDKIIVLNKGELMQKGSPQEIYNEPVNEFVAKFIGQPEATVIDSKLVGLNEWQIAIRPEWYSISEEGIDVEIISKMFKGKDFEYNFKANNFEGWLVSSEDIEDQTKVKLKINKYKKIV